jgi:hypothetical protein
LDVAESASISQSRDRSLALSRQSFRAFSAATCGGFDRVHSNVTRLQRMLGLRAGILRERQRAIKHPGAAPRKGVGGVAERAGKTPAAARPRGPSPTAAAARRTQRPTEQRRRPSRITRNLQPKRGASSQASPLLRPVIKAKLLARTYTVQHGTIRERVLTAMRAIGRRGAAEQVGLEAKK